ncbi:MAG TPA: carboxypeptidase-like regulatory domain-containing protein [Gemmatimonadaceae bacterium]|nr:carboxypeptidase-like regulatory domain-containing protein [Gemmatimonadaceae bacterium]
MIRVVLLGFCVIAALASVDAQPASSGICAPPGTRSGSNATLRPADDPRWNSKEPAALVGEVWNVDGQPIPDARVLLLGPVPIDSQFAGVLSAKHGGFTFRRIPPGVYVLEVVRIGYLRQRHDVDLIPAGIDTICIRLRAALRPAPLVEVRSP